MDIRKGVVVSRTNLIDNKKEAAIPWKGGGLVIFLVLAIWAGAFFYNDTSNKKMIVLQNDLNTLKQNRDYEKIAYVSDSGGRLNSIDEILANRIDWDRLFQKIEESTVPDVTFTSMEAKIVNEINNDMLINPTGATGTKYQITFKGSTVGLNNLSKQIMAFEMDKGEKSKPLANNIRIDKIDMKKTDSGEIDKGGSLDFTITIALNPEIVKSNLSLENK